MAIPLDVARTVLDEFGDDAVLQNLFSQAHAKHVLQEVREDEQNFPAFDAELDDKVTFAAYQLLSAGCSLVEQGERAAGVPALERAASLLEYVHRSPSRESRESGFHMLVAGMAFYAAGQYSRAFVALRRLDTQTPAAATISAFLRKNIPDLIRGLNNVLVAEAPEFEDNLEAEEWAITVAINRAIAAALEFAFDGDAPGLADAGSQLRDAASVAVDGRYPAWWWIVRLLQLMLDDLGEASPWRVLPPYLPATFASFARYVRGLAFSRYPVVEFWRSQRAAFPVALDLSGRGAVINLRTSAGKTRVAEVAILQSLANDPSARVFYLAPFRSLAIEVEHTLSSAFRPLGYEVSHLYGGSRVSAVDTELAEEAAVVIATPEKARALLRATPDFFSNVRLIIIDEGHLVGASERYVRNEVFIDHLRLMAQQNGARMLLLSAVLPNPQELAEWVSGDANAVARSDWKPSAERFGLLRWNGSRVRIEWQGDVASFNPRFIEARPLGFGRRKKHFPKDKNEAVAAAAVRLSTIGPVMIFSGRAVSVPTLAEAVLLALGPTPDDHQWPRHEWSVFEAVCIEELGDEAVELRAARAGIVCHSNRLAPQVRLALEHLMRSKPPRIIIATTTLAQGVNVGVSSVIVASPYTGKEPIDKRDFWNICGRAGRAFVDGEGKILYAIDDTREAWQVRNDEQLARRYFNAGPSDRVESGLLYVVAGLRRLAASLKVPFQLLLELAAENDFSRMGDKANTFSSVCELLDDELLALHVDPIVNPSEEEPSAWIDRVFRASLAGIQARSKSSDTTTEDVLAFLAARAESALRRVPASARWSVVASGLPLSVAVRSNAALDLFRAVSASYTAGGRSLPSLARAVSKIEKWVRENASEIAEKMPDQDRLDALRDGWLAGVGLHELTEVDENAPEFARTLYGYQLPWIVNAAAAQLRGSGDEEAAEALSAIALLVELGVPSENAARIFLAGVRSRAAATELASLELNYGTRVWEISRALRNPAHARELKTRVSEATGRWLDLLAADGGRDELPDVPRFEQFTLEGDDGSVVRLHCRRVDSSLFLSDTYGTTRFLVEPSAELPFDRVANEPRFVFERTDDLSWHLRVRDPRLVVDSE
jgi:hypothetical protein